MAEEKNDQHVVVEPTPTKKPNVLYTKPAIQKHAELTQVTFSTHGSGGKSVEEQAKDTWGSTFDQNNSDAALLRIKGDDINGR